MKTKYFIPLIFFIVPTVIASILMWPIEAMNFSLIGGFAVMIVSMVMTYVAGLKLVLKDKSQPVKKVER